MRQGLLILLALLVFALTCWYRFTAMGGHFAGFEDDQFVHVSQAQQLLLGERPTRDFVELGMPLTVALSAAAQVVGGRTLLSEAVLTISMLALCAAALFLLAARASGSIPIALAIALLQVAMAPRFYNYPKLLAYALAVAALWAYLASPGRRRAALVGAAGAAAFLLRHDHGVYVGMAAAIATVVGNWPRPRPAFRDAATALVTAVLCTTPYLVLTQFDGGVVSHFRDFVSFASRASAQTDLKAVGFDIDLSQPLWRRTTVPPAPVRIHVEWRGDVSEAERTAAERDLGLSEREPFSEEVWVYRLSDTTTGGLRAIVTDPRIEDTDGINRGSFTLDEPSPSERTPTYVQRLKEVDVLPGVMREANAAPYLYYVFSLTPVAALLLAALGWRAGAAGEPSRGTILVLSLLTVVVNNALLRGNLPSRLADVTVLVGILGAWVAATLIARTPRHLRSLPIAGVVILFVVAAASVQALEGVTSQVAQTGILDGVGESLDNGREIRALMSASPPIDAWGSDVVGIERVAHYVRSCTEPSDRLLTVSYTPWIYFMAGRGFAGGHVWLQARYFSTPEDERLIIERLQKQRPPIVLTAPSPRYSEYADQFPALTAFLTQTYTFNGQIDFGDDVTFRLLTIRGREPLGEYAPLGVPCFAAAAR